MSLMTENLLLQAQTLRLDGDIDTSIDLLRVVVKQCNADLQIDEKKSTADDVDGEEDEKKSTADDVASTNECRLESDSIVVLQLREMAAYQLAVLLLQRSGRRCNLININDSDVDETEANNILSKLGYKLRLSKLSFGYPICNCNRQQKRYNNTQPTASSPISAVVIDDILPLSIFNALQHAYRPESKYWSELYSKVNSATTTEKKNQFTSHNITLPPSNINTSSQSLPSSILEQVAILVQQQLKDEFPEIRHATSVEVWTHKRPPDGEHQLHYDMDEIRLWKHRKGSVNQGEDRAKRQKTNPKSNDGISCPIVSCVLTVNIPTKQLGCSICGKTGNSNPTIVCNQSILDRGSTDSFNVGCLCYPYPNRLLAFEGSLLHGVIPGIPQESSATSDNDESSSDEDSYYMHTSKTSPVNDDVNQRVTLMLGFWKDVCLTDNSAVIGPNVPFDSVSCSWKEEFNPVDMKESDFNHSGTKNSQLLNNIIDPLWVSIDEEDFGKYNAADSAKQCGRFFLESTDSREIDTKVLSGI